MKNKRHGLISTAILMFVLVMITAMLPMNMQEVQAAKKAKTYKITYKLNGGKNNKKNVKSLKKGKSFTLKNPTRTGYTFKGWYTNKNLKKGKITKIKKIKKKVTVYAKWEKNTPSNNQVPSTPSTPEKPQDTNTGNTGTNPGTSGSDVATKPEEPKDDHAADCAAGKHSWKRDLDSMAVIRHFYTACGTDITDLVNADSMYKFSGTMRDCPSCGTRCGSMTTKDIQEEEDVPVHCEYCGIEYNSSVTYD